MIKTINTLFVTMFGLGKVPKIPGTFGSLATVIILYLFFHIFNLSSNLILIFLIIIFILSFFAVANHIKDNENKDPKEVIIDEFIGQSIPIYLYEISHGTEKSSNEALIFYGICFVLFRFFDIAKPFPVNFFDKKFKNSFGVIMDDVMAGFYVVLSLICYLLEKRSNYQLQNPAQVDYWLAQSLQLVVHQKYLI
jgi:phosphatidylglycerophosphatase A